MKAGGDIDEIPIKPGVDAGKTFEQLLEEQLQAEEKRVRLVFSSPGFYSILFFKQSQKVIYLCSLSIR